MERITKVSMRGNLANQQMMTTVPKDICRELNIRRGDEIQWTADAGNLSARIVRTQAGDVHEARTKAALEQLKD